MREKGEEEEEEDKKVKREKEKEGEQKTKRKQDPDKARKDKLCLVLNGVREEVGEANLQDNTHKHTCADIYTCLHFIQCRVCKSSSGSIFPHFIVAGFEYIT